MRDGFELSEASNTPVMLEVRIRSCHVHGRFKARDNQRPKMSLAEALENPQRDVNRIVLPPASYLHEKEKIEKRWPAAVKFIRERGLNEHFGPADGRVGIVMQGGMYNGVMRALQRLGLADIRGRTDVPLYVLNVTYPLIDEEFLDFARDKDAVLVVEEGQPNHIEQAFGAMLHKAGIATKLFGKDPFPIAGEYTGAVMLGGVRGFLADECAGASRATATGCRTSRRRSPSPTSSKAVPPRPPGFCIGCPERPIFAAMKLVEKELGPHHVAADIGCHLFSILPPFNIGASTMGYGLGPASASAFNVPAKKRPISIMGDGGFWHNGLNSEHQQRRLQQARRRHDHRRQFLFGGDRRAGHPVLAREEPLALRPATSDRQGGARRRREMGAPDRPHLRREADARHAEGGADDEGEGPEDHRRLVGMHAEPAAPREAARREGDRRRRARREAALRRRRGCLHRRPRLHAALRLPVAVGEGARRSAARRSGRGDRRVLRRLRQLRRGGRRGGALPVLLPRRRDPQSARALGSASLRAAARARSTRLAAARGATSDKRPRSSGRSAA